jgi:hypothetical protein
MPRADRRPKSSPKATKRPKTRNGSPKRTDPLARDRALNAVNHMRRHGYSMTEAAQRAMTTPATIKRYAPSALKQSSSGRYEPTKYDRYTRTLYILTTNGKTAVTVSDSRTATRIAEYSAAVDHFLKTGKTDRLRPFRRQSFRAGKVGYPFLTDPKTLARLANAGEVSFEDLYALRG